MIFKNRLFLFSMSLLFVGFFYYLLFRQPVLGSYYLGVTSWHREWLSDSFFYWLPSFVHQLSFVLLTWLALDRKHKWFALLFWMFVNSIFELGQSSFWANDTLFLPKVIEEYLKNGTYSSGDMGAIFVATFVAYLIIKHIEKRESNV